MPLKGGYSHATFAANLAELLHAGHERNSAIMIAASKARQSFFKRFPAGALPNWLAFPKANRTAKDYDSGGRPLTGGVRSNPRNPTLSEMTPSQINKRLDALDAAGEKMTTYFIEAGRGHETMQDIMRGNDKAAQTMRDLYDRRMELVGEIERRYGPGAPRRLPPSRRVTTIRRNPTEPDRAALSKATDLYEGFTGKAPRKVHQLNIPPLPKAALAIGKVFGIMYSVDATGERFHHEFRSNAQPLLIVSPDGHQVYLHGGAFTFTKRGFVDKR